MPRVENYELKDADVGPLQGGRRDTFVSGAAAQKWQTVSRVGAQVYRDEVERQDEVAVLEADRRLAQWEQDALYNPQTGALTKRGKDSLAEPGRVGQEYDKFTGTLRESMANGRQQLMVDKLVAARRKDIGGILSRHVYSEMRTFDATETQSYIKNSQQAAALNYNDPERVYLEVDRQNAAITDWAKRNGMSGSATEKQMRSQAISDTHVGVIERYLANGQDQLGQEYFKHVKPEIAGDDAIKVEQKLKVASTEGSGQRAAADAWTKFGPRSITDPVDQNKMEDEMRKAIGDDPLVVKSALASLRERTSAHNATQREYNEKNSSDVWTQVASGASISQITRMPQYLSLPGKQQAEVKAYVQDRAKRDRGDSDLKTYYDLVNMATDPSKRSEFAAINLYDGYRKNLSDADFKHFATLQAAMRNGNVKEADRLAASDRVQSQMVNEALLSMKLDPTPSEKTSRSDTEKVLSFRRAVRESVRMLEQQQQKNATDEQVQGIVDNLLVKGTVVGSGVGGFFTTDRRVYELKEGENLAIKATDVPKAERAKIEAALKRAGRQVTNEAVTTLYQAKVLQMRGIVPTKTTTTGTPTDYRPIGAE